MRRSGCLPVYLSSTFDAPPGDQNERIAETAGGEVRVMEKNVNLTPREEAAFIRYLRHYLCEAGPEQCAVAPRLPPGSAAKLLLILESRFDCDTSEGVQ